MNNIHAILKATRSMNSLTFYSLLRRLALLLALPLLVALPAVATAAEQRTFATPEAAVDALQAALKANDEAALLAIFGDQHRKLVTTGDAAADAVERARVAKDLATFRVLDERGPDRRIVLMGAQAWPAPIPLVRKDGQWRFATEEGVEEVLNRRIGGNERAAIEMLNVYVAAQRLYGQADRNGDGVIQYAAKVLSTAGKHDGLFWPVDAKSEDEPSPLGVLAGESAVFLVGHSEGDPYRGYKFRILTRQGKSAAGGAYSYVINGRMVAGFAMIAYPATYGDSGVMTFVVNQNGKVFQKDLGRATRSVAPRIAAFDPGAGWTEVKP